jgi:ribonuclease P protein component
VAYVVSKRVGNAVLRNRIRRRLRAAVAERRYELRPGAAYLFGGGAEVATMRFDDLRTVIGALVARSAE